MVRSSVADSRLFDHLESTWTLRPGPTPGTTWLAFKVDFAFRSALYRHVADVFFDQVVRRMMAAFEGRCADLYGPSALARGGGARVVPRAGGASAAIAQQQQQQQQQHKLQRSESYKARMMPAAAVVGLHSAQQQQQQQQQQNARQQRQQPPQVLEHAPRKASA